MINKAKEFFIGGKTIKSVDSILSAFKSTVTELEETARQQDQVVLDKNTEIANLQEQVDAARVESNRAKTAAQKISSFFL